MHKNKILLPPLKHRPALYGSLLNGSPTNFFAKKESQEVLEIFQQLLKDYAKNKDRK